MPLTASKEKQFMAQAMNSKQGDSSSAKTGSSPKTHSSNSATLTEQMLHATHKAKIAHLGIQRTLAGNVTQTRPTEAQKKLMWNAAIQEKKSVARSSTSLSKVIPDTSKATQKTNKIVLPFTGKTVPSQDNATQKSIPLVMSNMFAKANNTSSASHAQHAQRVSNVSVTSVTVNDVAKLVPAVSQLQNDLQRQVGPPHTNINDIQTAKVISFGTAMNVGQLQLKRTITCQSTWIPEITERKAKELQTYLRRTSVLKTWKWKMHQLETFDWLLQRIITATAKNRNIPNSTNPEETADFEPLGGIFALERGLGKTITAIASMLLIRFLKSQRVAEFQQFQGPVLVVVPPMLLGHWEHELVEIAGVPRDEILIYHGPNRNFEILRPSITFVLTTYQSVVSGFKNFDQDTSSTRESKKSKSTKKSNLKRKRDTTRNILFCKYQEEQPQILLSTMPSNSKKSSNSNKHSSESSNLQTPSSSSSSSTSSLSTTVQSENTKTVSFFNKNNWSKLQITGRRQWMAIILDEGQLIANPKTQRAKAIYSLLSNCRLSLSGSTIQNRAQDLASQAAFVEGQTSFTTELDRRFRLLTSRQVSAWRDRYMKILDKSVLTLPNLYVYDYLVDLTEEEQDIYYERVEKSLKSYRSFHAATDTLVKNTKRHDLLVWLLRLNQCASDSEMARRSEEEKTKAMHQKVEKINSQLQARRDSFDQLVAEKSVIDDDEIDTVMAEWSLESTNQEPTDIENDPDSGEPINNKRRRLTVTRVMDSDENHGYETDTDRADPDLLGESDSDDKTANSATRRDTTTCDTTIRDTTNRISKRFSVEEQRQKLQYQKLCILCSSRICILDIHTFKQFKNCSHFACLACVATTNSGPTTILTCDMASPSLNDCCIDCVEQRNLKRRAAPQSTKTRAIIELIQLKLKSLSTNTSNTTSSSDETAVGELSSDHEISLSTMTSSAPLLTKLRHKKIVIFSRWKTYLKILMTILDSKTTFVDGQNKPVQVKYITLFGNMNSAERKTALDLFANDDSITILLSTLQCGGLGLNLVQASMGILCDQWWNPSTEDQARDRMYRMGQDHIVEWFYLKSKCGVEDALQYIKSNKQVLVDDFYNTRFESSESDDPNEDAAASRGNGLSDKEMTSVFRIIREDYEKRQLCKQISLDR